MAKDDALQTGVYMVDARCPRCGAIEEIAVRLQTVLTMPEQDIGSLKVRLRMKARDHDCKQSRIAMTEQGRVDVSTGEIK